MKQLHSVQALRGIAALAVFLAHLFHYEAGHAGREVLLTNAFIYGVSGVDLFFVISGFIMVWVAGDLPRGIASARGFLLARITRIYPLWWLFASVMVVYLWIFRGVPWEAARLDPQDLDGVTHLIKSYLLWPQADHPVLGVGWTLVHEMYFYLGFALLLFLLPARSRLLGVISWGGLLLIAAFLGLSDGFGTELGKLIFHPLTFEFVLGALVGFMIKAGWHKFAVTSFILGVSGFLIGLFLIAEIDSGAIFAPLASPPFSGAWTHVLLFGIPTALLLYGVVALELQEKLRPFSPKALVDIGDWSYALYLCHSLTVAFVGRITYGLIGSDQIWKVGLYLAGTTIATFIIAALSYHWFERPMIRFFRQWRSPPPPIQD